MCPEILFCFASIPLKLMLKQMNPLLLNVLIYTLVPLLLVDDVEHWLALEVAR